MKCENPYCYIDAEENEKMCSYHIEMELQKIEENKDEVFTFSMSFDEAMCELICPDCAQRIEWQFDPDPEFPNHYAICCCEDRTWLMYPESMNVMYSDKLLCRCCGLVVGRDDSSNESGCVCIECGGKV